MAKTKTGRTERINYAKLAEDRMRAASNKQLELEQEISPNGHVISWKEFKKAYTDDMVKRCCRLLYATWSAIGCDILAAVSGEETGDYSYDGAERTTMKRSEVIDAVSNCGFVGGYPENYGNDQEALEWLEGQSRAAQDRILKKAFPYSTYGM